MLERTAVEPLPPLPLLPSVLLLNCRQRTGPCDTWVGNTVLTAQPWWKACRDEGGRVGKQQQLMGG